MYDFKVEPGTNASQLLSQCVELQTLALTCDEEELFLNSSVALPKLRSLSLSLTTVTISAVMERLLVLNSQLVEIILLDSLTREMVGMLRQYVPNIVRLKSHWVIEDWRIFKNLKSLDIYSFDGSLVPVLTAVADAAIPLERLRVRGGSDAELSGQISKLKHLRELELVIDEEWTLYVVLTIVRSLPHLSTISIRITRSDSLFAGIPEIVKCGLKVQSITYSPNEREYVDAIWFLRVRDAIVNRGELRPFRLNFGALSNVVIGVPKKMQDENSHILQMRFLERI